MYHRSNDYALNKQDPDAIVCRSVTGVHIRLRREDFSSDEEFQIWKEWSDADYHAAENADGQLLDHSLPINILLDCPAPSAEDTIIEYIEQKEQEKASKALAKHIKSLLTQKQYTRLCLYYLHGMSEAEIGKLEGVGQQRISRSLLAARKKLQKFFQSISENRG